MSVGTVNVCDEWGGSGYSLFEDPKNGREVVAFYSEVRHSVPALFHSK
jgi:hypothetical protein